VTFEVFCSKILCALLFPTRQSAESRVVDWPLRHYQTGLTMAKIDFKTVDEYIAAQPETVRGALERVRSTIRKALPGAEEVISYKIPAYRLHGRIVLYFAGWRQHYSLYPTSHAIEAFEDDLAPYDVDKGTIRFPLSRPVPVKLIERIAKFRAKEVAKREKAKATTPNKQ
jgi:uncharacterized protein YdhG (YjbR/CyaY superfamily)